MDGVFAAAQVILGEYSVQQARLLRVFRDVHR